MMFFEPYDKHISVVLFCIYIAKYRVIVKMSLNYEYRFKNNYHNPVLCVTFPATYTQVINYMTLRKINSKYCA